MFFWDVGNLRLSDNREGIFCFFSEGIKIFGVNLLDKFFSFIDIR